MGRDYAGDRLAAGRNDRYLLLEDAVPRKRYISSWSGRSIRDNASVRLRYWSPVTRYLAAAACMAPLTVQRDLLAG